MTALIAVNLVRHKARTLATAIGIALGVGMIVALLSVGEGLSDAAEELVHLGQADLGIFQAGVQDPTASVLPVSLTRRVDSRPEVAGASPLMLMVGAVKQSAGAIVFGLRPHDFVARRLVITAGARDLAPGNVLVGDHLAGQLHLHPGSRMRIKGRPFEVTGIYHSGVFFQDAGAAISLATAQRLERRPGDATTIAVQLGNGVDHGSAEAALRKSLPGTNIIGAGDPSRIGANGELIHKAVDVVAALALIVGGLGVSNTMAMSVLERERELALLNAVGWRRWRIGWLVLGEGLVTSLIGAAIGLLIGVVGAGLLNDALGAAAVVSPAVSASTILEALLIGLAIGVCGGLYPAWRGVTVPPNRLLGDM